LALVAGQSNIPLDVSLLVCIDCGAYSVTSDESCRPAGHGFSTVYNEIAARQVDPVALERVADLQKHGRRLLAEDSGQ
jgi:hypothetical protein